MDEFDARRRGLHDLGAAETRGDRKAMLSIGVGEHEKLLEITRPARARYAELHGYDVVEITQLLAPERPPSWSKIPLMQSSFREYSTLLWVDADAVICDFETDVANELDPSTPFQLVSHEYGGQLVPNCGVMLLHRTDRVQLLLHDMWESIEFSDHKWWENAALLHLLGYTMDEPIRKTSATKYDDLVGELPGRWNTIPQVGGDAPAIVHLPGTANDVRIGCLARLVAEPGDAPLVVAEPSAFATP